MSLQVWLPLNGDLHNQGLSNITATNSGATVDNNGKIGKCYSFDGNDDFISISCSDLYNTFSGGSQPFSIAFWVYHADTTRAIIFGDYGLSGAIGFNVELTTSHQVRFYWNGTPDKHFNVNASVGINTWTHIIITYDGNEICIYKNGVQQSDKYSGTLAAKSKTSGMFYLGRDYRTGTTTLNGKINDFRIYDHCLSPRECKQVSTALVLHYPLNRGGFGRDNIITGTSPNEIQYSYPSSGYKDYFTRSTTIIPTASQYTLSFWAKSTVDGDNVHAYYYYPNTTTTCVSSQGISKTASDGGMPFTLSTTWEYYWVTYTQTETTNVKRVIFPRMFSSGSGVVSVKCVKFEEGSVPTAWCPNEADDLYSQMGLDNNIEYDVSGYGHNGTKHGITYDSDTPRYQTCAVLDGTSYIKIDTNEWMVHGAQALTWSIWAYSDDWSAETDGGRLISCTETGGFNIEGGTSGYLRVPFYVFKDSKGSSKGYVYYNSSIQLASLTPGWHLFTTTYSTEAIKTYVDGVLTYSYSYTSYGIGFNKNARLFLGCEANTANPGGAYFKGKLSDFRLFYSTLSAQDVYNLYTVGASLSDTGVLFSNEVSEV